MIPWWSRASILIPTTSFCCEGRGIRMVPARSAQQHHPNCPQSTAAPLKDRQTDRHSCLLGLPPEDPTDRGFYSPQQGCLQVGVSSAFHSVVFSPSSARHSTGQASCTGGQQKVYFCIILREFEVSFFSWAQNRLHTKTMRSFPSPIPFIYKRWI